MNSNYQAIIQVLKSIRKNNEESVASLARSLKRNAHTVKGWEDGTRTPGIESLCAWANHYKMDIGIFGRD